MVNTNIMLIIVKYRQRRLSKRSSFVFSFRFTLFQQPSPLTINATLCPLCWHDFSNRHFKSTNVPENDWMKEKLSLVRDRQKALPLRVNGERWKRTCYVAMINQRLPRLPCIAGTGMKGATNGCVESMAKPARVTRWIVCLLESTMTVNVPPFTSALARIRNADDRICAY